MKEPPSEEYSKKNFDSVQSNSHITYSAQFSAVASVLQKMVQGSIINSEEEEIFSWGAVFLESLYDLPAESRDNPLAEKQNNLPPKPQRDQPLESLIRRYYGSFSERLQEANIPLQQDYGKMASESLRHPETPLLSKEQLKDLQKAFVALSRKMQNHEITYCHEQQSHASEPD